ncbi:Appr-1-p processing protein [Candidatus Parcubacteria bacterium]|nr:MAG: Appr-1-p processing protein [Candidatus Parcubacteria bacterium]
MRNLQIHLRDLNPEMVAAWKTAFKDCPVTISEGHIFFDPDNTDLGGFNPVIADALVSPANSFGFMDGGIDMVYTRALGWDLSKRLRDLIQLNYSGELLVGQAAIIDIPLIENLPISKNFKYLISAPTMRVPMDVSRTVNAYLAFKAVLREAIQHPSISSILCPGLGTAIGLMDTKVCAKQMRAAWDEIDSSGLWRAPKYETLTEAFRHHATITPYFRGDDV